MTTGTLEALLFRVKEPVGKLTGGVVDEVPGSKK
jgi:hypothetical protein